MEHCVASTGTRKGLSASRREFSRLVHLSGWSWLAPLGRKRPSPRRRRMGPTPAMPAPQSLVPPLQPAPPDARMPLLDGILAPPAAAAAAAQYSASSVRQGAGCCCRSMARGPSTLRRSAAAGTFSDSMSDALQQQVEDKLWARRQRCACATQTGAWGAERGAQAGGQGAAHLGQQPSGTHPPDTLAQRRRDERLQQRHLAATPCRRSGPGRSPGCTFSGRGKQNKLAATPRGINASVRATVSFPFTAATHLAPLQQRQARRRGRCAGPAPAVRWGCCQRWPAGEPSLHPGQPCRC